MGPSVNVLSTKIRGMHVPNGFIAHADALLHYILGYTARSYINYWCLYKPISGLWPIHKSFCRKISYFIDSWKFSPSKGSRYTVSEFIISIPHVLTCILSSFWYYYYKYGMMLINITICTPLLKMISTHSDNCTRRWSPHIRIIEWYSSFPKLLEWVTVGNCPKIREQGS